MNENMVIGPDPSTLTDSELVEVATKLAALGQRIAGTPGHAPNDADVAQLPPVDLWLFHAIRVPFDILKLELEHRQVAADTLHAEIAAFLEGGAM